LQTVATSGVADKETKEALERPKGSSLDVGSIQLSLSPSALAGLQEGARYLLEYPYGCLEQRMSRSLPVIVGADLVSAFGLGTMGNLKGEVQHELDHLGDYQHPSGGFGYWTHPWQPDPFITAYALEVAKLAAKAGYRVPTEITQRAVAWLKIYLSSRQTWAYPYSENEEYAARAYTVYVLALYGQAPTNYFTQLYERRDQIPYLAKAYLAKAAPLLTTDAKIQKTLNDELLNQSRLSPTTMHFEEPSETRMPWIHASTVVTTSVILQALLESQGGFPGDEKVIRWLTQERKEKGRWRTTQENADSLRAFQDFYKRYEKDVPQFTATVSRSDAGAKTLWTERFEGRTLVDRKKQLSFSDVFGNSDASSLLFRKDGTGRLYYTLRMRYAPALYDKPEWEGFEIEKTVKPLYGSDKNLKAGARAVVTIKVRTKQDRTFVAVNDPLPGGFEIVDPTFATEGHEDARQMKQETPRAPDWGGFQRNENYDDRIQIFADFLEAGEHTYSYLVQATTPGTFATPATYVEQMYEPEVYGRTTDGKVTIQK
jgi:alpha-2-macroglobulin